MSPPQPFTVITRVPIPARLSPSAVLAALHAYEPLIKANPYLDRYERRHVTADDVAGDSLFFSPDHYLENDDNGGHGAANPNHHPEDPNLQGFVVYDRVPIIPGLGSWASKEVAVPCIFQRSAHGVRCRADAVGGVTVRSRYEVRRRGEIADADDGGHPVAHDSDGDGDDDGGAYELVDISSIECGALVRPFVKLRFSSGHQEILRRVVDEVMHAQAAAAAGPQSGR
jgi:hypothetical protein